MTSVILRNTVSGKCRISFIIWIGIPHQSDINGWFVMCLNYFINNKSVLYKQIHMVGQLYIVTRFGLQYSLWDHVGNDYVKFETYKWMELRNLGYLWQQLVLSLNNTVQLQFPYAEQSTSALSKFTSIRFNEHIKPMQLNQNTMGTG